jgi:hypothetical protein
VTREFAVRLGHIGSAALLPIKHKLDLVAVAVKSIEHREIALAGYAKGMRDTLGHKAFNKKVACNFCSHLIID